MAQRLSGKKTEHTGYAYTHQHGRHEPTTHRPKRTKFHARTPTIEPIYPSAEDTPAQFNIRLLAAQPDSGVQIPKRMEEVEQNIVVEAPQEQLIAPPRRESAAYATIQAESEITKGHQMQQVVSPLVLESFSSPQKVRSKKAARNRLYMLLEFLSAFLRRAKALLARLPLSARSRAAELAIMRLSQLYALMSAGVDEDGMEMVRLRVAFGETYYHICEATQRHGRSRPHPLANNENYSTYLEQFLRNEP